MTTLTQPVRQPKPDLPDLPLIALTWNELLNCHLSHLMHVLKPDQNQPQPPHHPRRRFQSPDTHCSLHLGFFQCSFVCCLNALHFDCVRLCWLAIAELIKSPEERLLRAPSCEGLRGQVPAELMELSKGLFAGPGVIILPACLHRTVLYGYSSSRVVNGGSLGGGTQDAADSLIYL